MMTKAMMSGDSPDTHHRPDPLLELELKERAACTSNGAGKLAGETVTASVLVEPTPKQQNMATAIPFIDDKVTSMATSSSANEETIQPASTLLNNKSEPENVNGPLDSLDGDPTKLNSVHKPKRDIFDDDEEDESCGVKCLYYTLQCCECTIM